MTITNSKLKQIEELCVEPPLWKEYQEYMGRYRLGFRNVKSPMTAEEVAEYQNNMAKASQMLRDICMLDSMTVDDRYKALIAYVRFIPEDGLDMLSRFRDLLTHLRGRQHDDMVKILTRVTRCSQLNSHERMITAVTLYNCFEYTVCYNCFSDLACDKAVVVKYRVEATRYLFASDDEDNLQTAQEALLEIINSNAYPSEFRYKTIAGFISKTGIATILNTDRLKIPYDEEFVYSLQTVFFFNKNNDVRSRILSGQHMLQMECVTEDEKKEVGCALLDIATSTEYEENVRADAADTVLRLGSPEQVKQSRRVIEELGHEEKGTTFMERMRTVYTNKQNVHDDDVSEFTDQFIKKIVSETHIRLQPYHDVHREVTEIVRAKGLESTLKFKAFEALNRISIDTATFTKASVTMADIFVHVWARIKKYSSQQQVELEDRLIQELVDMAETCSSGHASRLVNVLSAYDDTLTISWGTQIKANIAGRMNVRIRNIPDEDTRSSVALGMLDTAEEEDAVVYRKFISDNVPLLKIELRKEFVGEGYIKQPEFDTLYDASVRDLFPSVGI